MANLPYVSGNESKVLGILKMYSRMGAYPLDATSVFNTKADLEAYINEAGSYAYAGQVVAVANGNVTDTTHDDDYSLYIIKSDKTVQEIGKNLTFSSITEAERFISTNPNGIRVGELITIADSENGTYDLYMVRGDKSLKRVSFETSDVPDVSWANLQGKPTSSVEDIDDAVAKKHEHENLDILDKLTEDASGKPVYNNTELAYKEDITWANIQEKPTTAEEFGFTDVYTKTEAEGLFVEKTEVVTTAEANKILKLDADAKLPANILSGIIPIENIPHGALERCVVVASDTERFALTSDNVQVGDTIKVNDTGKMYFVVDADQLSTEDGYEVYTAGSASSVSWSGVTDAPSTLAGYGITDAVSSNDVVTAPEAGKLLKLDNDGKLPTNITGDADTVDGRHASDFVAATDVVTTAEANKVLKLNADAKLPASITGDADTVDGMHASDFVAATDVVTTAEANKVLKLNAEGKLPADITGNAATATSVDWSGVQNKPTTAEEFGITDAVSSNDVVTTAEANKLLKLDDEGKLPADITGNAATATSVDWSGVQNKPTTAEGYGITDTYTKTEAEEKFIDASNMSSVAEANKLLKLDDEGKLPADITGNAATATSVDWSGVQNKPTTAEEFGITDIYTKTEAEGLFVEKTEVVETAAAGKILKLDDEAKLPASILSGIIPLENLPHGALERCVVVPSDTARFALTSASVQKGDTVKVTATGKMYFVVDDTQLGTEAGYEIYTAGSASSVAWSGVSGTPDTLSGYGITDAYNKSESDSLFVKNTEVVTAAEANKVLKLNADGKLPADITGNAATATSVDWAGVQNRPTTAEEFGITDIYTKTEAEGLFVEKTEVVTTAEANKILTLDADGKLPADITGTAGAVAWANVTDKPTSSVEDIDGAVAKAHEHENIESINKFGETEDGKMTYGENEVA